MFVYVYIYIYMNTDIQRDMERASYILL